MTQLVVDVVSDNSVIVRWSPPVHANGILTYYTVVVFNKQVGYNFSSQVNSLEDREVSISGLSMSYNVIIMLISAVHKLSDFSASVCNMHSDVFVPYTVQVFASTEAGRGNPATSLVYTRHGGK